MGALWLMQWVRPQHVAVLPGDLKLVPLQQQLGGIAAFAGLALDSFALYVCCAMSNPQWDLHCGFTHEHWENTIS